LPPELSQQLINDIGILIRDGTVFSNGDLSAQVVKGLQVRFISLPDDKLATKFGVAKQFYSKDGFKMMQCVWPNPEGILPNVSNSSQVIYAPLVIVKPHFLN
jgi:hypothetical protein